ncbi:MAG: D-glycerate dehydrogenase [Planctomycetes bacterium]|nr:D-glycerate dehydrogenase [Planctomycetota bacterium]
MSIFVTRRIPESGFAVLRAAGVPFEVGQDDDERPLAHEGLLRGARRHPVLLCHLTDRVDSEVLAGPPTLRGVSQMAVGYDNIDVAAARGLGVPIANTPGVLTDATADLAFALLLAAARRVVEGDRFVRDGRFVAWGPNLMLGAGVGPAPDGAKKVLGIAGFGRIGKAMARRALGFGMRVLAWSRRREDTDGVEWIELDELFAQSDFVSLHLPLSPSTRHLVDARRLALMKPTAFLINTARGPVVDEGALAAVLRARRIAGAGLDVYEREPVVHEGLLGLDNVVLLPHLGSGTIETRARMAVMAAESALAFVRGERAEWELKA